MCIDNFKIFTNKIINKIKTLKKFNINMHMYFCVVFFFFNYFIYLISNLKFMLTINTRFILLILDTNN